MKKLTNEELVLVAGGTVGSTWQSGEAGAILGSFLYSLIKSLLR